MNLSSKKSAGTTTTAPIIKCNQLSAALWQLEHFIFHTGSTVPQLWQDQIIFVNLHVFHPLGFCAPVLPTYSAVSPVSIKSSSRQFVDSPIRDRQPWASTR